MKKYILDFWNSLSPLYKIIIIVIISLLVISLIKKYWSQLSSFFQPRKINYQNGENAGNQGYTAGGGDPTKGKSFIETIANNIYNDIYDTPLSGHTAPYYEDANSLSDSDLLYLADYYKKYLSRGVSLWEDLDNESFIFTDSADAADKLKSRLLQIGSK